MTTTTQSTPTKQHVRQPRSARPLAPPPASAASMMAATMTSSPLRPASSPPTRRVTFLNGLAWVQFIDSSWGMIASAESHVPAPGSGSAFTWSTNISVPTAELLSSTAKVPDSIAVRFNSVYDMQAFLASMWDRVGPEIRHLEGEVGGQGDQSRWEVQLLRRASSAIQPPSKVGLDEGAALQKLVDNLAGPAPGQTPGFVQH